MRGPTEGSKKPRSRQFITDPTDDCFPCRSRVHQMQPYRFTIWLSAIALILGVAGVVCPRVAHAQELDCSVSVDYSQLSGSDYSFLDDLEQGLREYLNEHVWTDDDFRDVERIDCSFEVLFQEAISLTEFRARVVVATLRPIHGSTQSTPVIRLSDTQWRFQYARNTPLVHDLNTFNPLTSLIDYYAYLILGYDYDTFSEKGGTPHFQQAREIADRARSAGGSGWSQLGGSPNRSELITQLLDPRFDRLRTVYYRYHFGGLDRFVQETETARTNVLDVLADLQDLYRDVSRTHALDMFFAAKYQELAALFEQAPSRAQAYAILSDIDPAHLSEYNRLVN